MSSTSTVLASVNGLMASATISSLLSQGFTIKGSTGPFDTPSSSSFFAHYPEAARSIPWVRLPYLGAPDAFEPEIADADYVLHATEGLGFLLLEGGRRRAREEKRRRRQVPMLRALSVYSKGFDLEEMTPTSARPIEIGAA
ncbi:hypothetical protein DACRYDRAFT_24181 [Dacryopinax primogenitus]|uniref:Uncharacterized protein n=1 Tax=Dacryopinax primogenitus (strain DJM 731) TaxID=1858805 RepID=M5G5U8_DACPD|nr:uncharacterized protein DACRYDRAFT_24181 [Dacryopinax primogenitus]EJT99132.1 hypothetical protein DACRYDRAFT_24181 [Dacryopinax primogenitus]